MIHSLTNDGSREVEVCKKNEKEQQSKVGLWEHCGLRHVMSPGNSWIFMGLLMRKLMRTNTHRSKYSWEKIFKDPSINVDKFLAGGSSSTCR